MKLVLPDDVRTRSNIREGDAYDLAISAVLEQTSFELARLIRTESFDQAAHVDTFYLDARHQAVRPSSQPFVELSLKNAFVVEPPAVTVKWHPRRKELTGDGETLATDSYTVLAEPGIVRLEEDWVVDAYYEIAYTSGFLTEDDSDFGTVVSDTDDLPAWLFNAAIQYAIEALKADQDDGAKTKKRADVPLVPVSVTHIVSRYIRVHDYAVKSL